MEVSFSSNLWEKSEKGFSLCARGMDISEKIFDMHLEKSKCDGSWPLLPNLFSNVHMLSLSNGTTWLFICLGVMRTVQTTTQVVANHGKRKKGAETHRVKIADLDIGPSVQSVIPHNVKTSSGRLQRYMFWEYTGSTHRMGNWHPSGRRQTKPPV
mmetsp:Transcript_29147/g.67580  ORF Transcript_29147/g.67580 Transcript_29147/m.67580 type:complete len:155 (+) Transcript_29147:939-1403(+)